MIELPTVMLGSKPHHGYQPHLENRKSLLSLRWLLIILASYLTVFSYVGAPEFRIVFGYALLFAASNIALSLAPIALYQSPKIQRVLAITDLICVSIALYLLRQPGTYFYIPFVLVF